MNLFVERSHSFSRTPTPVPRQLLLTAALVCAGALAACSTPAASNPTPAAPASPGDAVATPTVAEPFVPDLSTMSVRTLTSLSTNGEWLAESLVASFPGEPGYEYVRLTVSRPDQTASWIAFEELDTYGGLGSAYPSHFAWSADGRYLYFEHSGTSDGCGYLFTTRFHQVELSSGRLREIPLTGMQFGEITLSPTAEVMAFKTDEGILVHDLPAGTDRLVPYPWPEGFGYLVGWNAWSPDGRELAFSITTPLCDSPDPSATTIVALNLETGETRTPSRSETWVYLPAGLATDPVPTATLALQEFLESLFHASRGGEGDPAYQDAIRLYGGGYDALIEINPDLNPEDRAGLLRAACEHNGYHCLRLRDVIASDIRPAQDGPQMVFFTVQLEAPNGEIFALGPCCGEESGLPQTQFSFAVRQASDGTYQVLELPPYSP